MANGAKAGSVNLTEQDWRQILSQRSVPLTMKKFVPAVAAVAYVYSEDQLVVFDTFETTNLARFVNKDGQVNITRFLVQDINARIGWIECADTEQRLHLCRSVAKRYSVASDLSDTSPAPSANNIKEPGPG